MKTYHLRFTQNDFTTKSSAVVGSLKTYTWRTPIYDLYDNAQYKNYTVKRANYGTDLLGNGVYTGLNKINATTTEIGYVLSGRFVDTSSRVDLVDWRLTFDSTIGVEIASYLSVYTTDFSGATPHYANVWTEQKNILPGRSIYNIDTNRYAYFEIVFTVDTNIDITGKSVELIIAVEIDAPTINGYFPSTRRLQDKFPAWMALREYNPDDPFSATPATPSSIGGQFLNAAAGEWLTDLDSKIRYQQFQFHIDTADIDQKAWAYVAQGIDPLIWSITGDDVQLARTADFEEFYTSENADNVFFWNRSTDEIYTNVKYTTLSINGQTFQQKAYHIWNAFDDIGASVDLFRIQSATPSGYLEDNESFKSRILDVYQNKSGIHKTAFQKSIRRELNLWKYSGSTPDSNYLGATPEVLEISDLENDPEYFINGLPTQKFKDLVQDLSIRYPMTWGYFDYGKAFWDADGIAGHKGFSFLPHQLDATPASEQYIESGIGDGNDLYIFKPKELTGPISFNTSLKVRGRVRTTRTEYIPLTFGVKVYGIASDDLWANPAITGYFTIELTVIDNSATPASPNTRVYYCNIDITATNDINYYLATPSAAARAFVEWTTTDGYTDLAYQFKDKITGQSIGRIDLANVSKVDIKLGNYNGNSATPSYTDQISQSNFKLWFDGEPNTYIGLGAGTTLTKSSYNYINHFGAFWFESQATSHTGVTANAWKSEEFNYSITLNGVRPNMTVQNYVLTMPPITWPASTSSPLYTIEITTTNGISNYGAFSDAVSSTPIFIPSSYIAVDGNTTWTSNYKKTFAASTVSVTFSTTSGAAYPVTSSVWNNYEKSITTPISGIVDENGPWRNNSAASIGNTNYILSTLSLTRNSFNIPNSSNYILTWIGVESVSNDNVISWIDNNTIKPAVTDPGEVNINSIYPDGVLVETLVGGVYTFSTFNIYARVKPGVNTKWNPKAHSGWFYDDTDEYYLYASPNTESATGTTHILKGLNRQGAPILVKSVGSTPSVDLRQTAFFDPEADPVVLSISNKEVKIGNGTPYLRVAYKNIYGISVKNLTTGQSVSVTSSTSTTNIVTCTTNTNSSYEYEITYTPKYSFYVDNEYTDTDKSRKSKLVFDKRASDISATSYKIDYETSIYDPATPIDVALNANYTSIHEGFIYIDHDIHDLNQIEVSLSPTKIAADGYDYTMITVRSYDTNGNPKPYQTFHMYTNFGRIIDSVLTTDIDGFAYTTLISNRWSPATPSSPATPALQAATPGGTTQGLVLLDGPGTVDAKVGFEIQIPVQSSNRIVAVLDSDYILADGNSATFIYGKVETAAHTPVPYAYIYWRKSRDLYDLFRVTWSTSSATPGSTILAGRVTADANGRFSIGPFLSSTASGYWLASVESNSASPSGNYTLVGDVVYWYEYPNVTNIIDPVTQMPTSTVQSATPWWNIPTYTLGSAFPTTYDESTTQAGYNSNVIIWTPPSWYAIDKYKQYQMGLYGSQYGYVGATPNYPEYKDL